MGGIGVSNASPFYLNMQNPALLARRGRFTAFEVGLIGQYKPQISQLRAGQTQSQRDFGANLNYVALAFPASSRWTMMLSLRPYTYVDYSTKSYGRVLRNNTNTIYEAEYTYSGRGAINKAAYTTGFRLGKNIYVGAEAGFLFGNITNNSDARVLINDVAPTSQQLNPQPQDIVVSRSNRVLYNDFVWRLGAGWRPKLSEKWSLNLGATIDPATRVGATETDVYQQVSLGTGTGGGGNSLSDEDTLRANVASSIRLPQQAHFGISIEQINKLMVGLDVGFQRWSQFQAVNGRSGNLLDAMTIGVGLEYMPKANSTKYWDLVTYRAGFQVNQTPYLVDGQRVKDVNGSLGLSLPMGSYFVNYVNLSVQGGQRGALVGSQIRERYVRFALGLSLNDWWFRKPVLD
ncbi:hypothetical protein [Rudanella paleaurantiibacter]|nr:hypothetical protein [Rudanella paleaurantiibacter]